MAKDSNTQHFGLNNIHPQEVAFAISAADKEKATDFHNRQQEVVRFTEKFLIEWQDDKC